MVCRTATLVVCMLCFAAPQLTDAAESEDLHPYLERAFSLDIGVFYPDRELDLRVKAANTNGIEPGINCLQCPGSIPLVLAAFTSKKTIYNIDAQKIGLGSASVNELARSTGVSHLKRKC